ncbi:SOS response-associated peptidase [Cereibacter sphaeroides]|uniref:SOS response-associated peptidase n=1 Tax=Cereibacter sphaeroides TaxID=1063 RepID=UPI000305B25A|nr:SOS response-associated peptidase [Cereibacter sphaeroides]
MCGRMAHKELTWAQLAGWMQGLAPGETEIETRYNVPPTAMIPIVRQGPLGLQGDLARWGLIPAFHRGSLKDWKATTINARIESVATAPSFRAAYRGGRCLVLASGYYEWQVRGGVKYPHYIRPSGNAPALLMAGLESRVRLPDYEGPTCAVLTEPVRGALAQVHDRMPVMMGLEAAADWLGGCPVEALPRLPMETLGWHEVGRTVSSIRNEGPDLIEPIEPVAPDLFSL